MLFQSNFDKINFFRFLFDRNPIETLASPAAGVNAEKMNFPAVRPAPGALRP